MARRVDGRGVTGAEAPRTGGPSRVGSRSSDRGGAVTVARRGARRIPVAIIGGGQAGLAVSWYLTRDGIPHLVLERDTLMHSWRDARWDSFCLVTPNWQCRLPGYHYSGPESDGFMTGAEVTRWLSGYPATFRPPVQEHTEVTSVRPLATLAGAGGSGAGSGFLVETGSGNCLAQQVVVATGGYHRPAVPRLATQLPQNVLQVHSADYRNPGALPPGPVLVVGSGQSGAQIAEDLFRAGRTVHLAVGSAPRCARRYRGRDVVAWLHDIGLYDKPVTDRPDGERTRDRGNHYLTGRDGGRDLDLRDLARRGMVLHGRLTGMRGGGRLAFADDLEGSLNAADATYNRINGMIDEWIAGRGLTVPEPPSRYRPVWRPPGQRGSRLAATRLAAVVWATGYRPDYRWLHAGAFDEAGHPLHLRGVTAVPGLYHIGLPWLHTWGSGRFAGIETDAAYLAGRLKARYQADRAVLPFTARAPKIPASPAA